MRLRLAGTGTPSFGLFLNQHKSTKSMIIEIEKIDSSVHSDRKFVNLGLNSNGYLNNSTQPSREFSLHEEFSRMASRLAPLLFLVITVILLSENVGVTQGVSSCTY